MNPDDRYFRYVAWSDEDQCFVGYCPDLIFGGACHGESALEVFAELCRIIRIEVRELQLEGQPLPQVRTLPPALSTAA